MHRIARWRLKVLASPTGTDDGGYIGAIIAPQDVKFFKRSQHDCESATDFIVELLALAKIFTFGAYLEMDKRPQGSKMPTRIAMLS